MCDTLCAVRAATPNHDKCFACADERSDRCDATRAAGVLQPSFCPDTLRVSVYLSYRCVTHVLARVRPRPYENMPEFVLASRRLLAGHCVRVVILYCSTPELCREYLFYHHGTYRRNNYPKSSGIFRCPESGPSMENILFH